MTRRLRPFFSMVVLGTLVWGVLELLALQRAHWRKKTAPHV